VEALKAKGYDREGESRQLPESDVSFGLLTALGYREPDHSQVLGASEGGCLVVDALISESCKMARTSPQKLIHGSFGECKTYNKKDVLRNLLFPFILSHLVSFGHRTEGWVVTREAAGYFRYPI
jgi:hypothetical protein